MQTSPSYRFHAFNNNVFNDNTNKLLKTLSKENNDCNLC